MTGCLLVNPIHVYLFIYLRNKYMFIKRVEMSRVINPTQFIYQTS